MCKFAGVAELADATVLGAAGATREGSSPFARTKIIWKDDKHE